MDNKVTKTLFFENEFNYINHDGMMAMLGGKDGGKLEELARNISVCLHEDWKKNLVREKGKEYQHFRPVKDPELEKRVLENPDEYLNQVSEDGKKLYRIVENTDADGKVTKAVQFDLIRVPFEKLTKKWQEANLDAAKFALCLVKTCVERGDLDANKTPEEIFRAFEAMSHDVHLEWMFREGGWASEKLLLPYEYLTVDTNGYNQKDKDRAHVVATTSELTFQPNILARNRSIVIRAIDELFGSNAVKTGLRPDIMKRIVEIQPFIDAQNEHDYNKYLFIKATVEKKAEKILSTKQELSFEDLEKLAEAYFDSWKNANMNLGLPEEVNVPYNKLLVDDKRVNYKNIARAEVAQILMEMIKEKKLGKCFENSVKSIGDSNSEIGKKIIELNEADYANFQLQESMKGKE